MSEDNVKTKFKTIMELIKYLSSLGAGEAYESFYQSIVNDFIANGYSEIRAKQVINEMVENVKNSSKN